MNFPGKNITRIWLLFLCIFPLAMHAVHLYPELPAATLLMGAYLFAFSPAKNYWLTGFCLALIPWFHVKYIPPAVILGVAVLYSLIKPLKQPHLTKEKLLPLLKFVILPIISLVLLLIYCKTLYGAYSPTNVFPKENYWTVPWLLRLKVLAAYFLDQRDGLLFYAPVFFLAFFGLKKSNIQNRGLLVAILFSYVGFHAFTTVRGAYSPAGRPLLFVSWILILFIVQFYYTHREQNSHTAIRAFRYLAGMSFFILAWFLYYPLFMYQPVVSQTTQGAADLNLFLGSNLVPLWKMFPSFLTFPQAPHPANWFWILLTLSLIAFYYFKPFPPQQETHSDQDKAQTSWKKSIPAVVLFLGCGYLYCLYPHVQWNPQNKYIGKPLSFFNNSRNFCFVDDGKIFRIKGGNDYDIYIDRKLVSAGQVTFRFTNTDAVDVAIRNGRKLLFQSAGQKETVFIFNINQLKELSLGGYRVSHLGFETKNRGTGGSLLLKIE